MKVIITSNHTVVAKVVKLCRSKVFMQGRSFKFKGASFDKNGFATFCLESESGIEPKDIFFLGMQTTDENINEKFDSFGNFVNFNDSVKYI